LQAEGKAYFLGCSGYFYRDWKGRFYPEELKPSGWFRYYAERFNTVELNSTFYHFPKKASLRRLYRESPADFRISVKVNRLVTHRKRFRDTEEIVRGFYEVVSDALGEKLGCLLFLSSSFPPLTDTVRRALRGSSPSLTGASGTSLSSDTEAGGGERCTAGSGKRGLSSAR